VSFKLLSHPDYLLKNHIEGVYEKGMKIFDSNKIFEKDRALMRLILLFHDFGKASRYFQDYIDPCKDKPVSDLKNHAEFSAVWLFYYSQEVLRLSLLDSYLGFICVKKHHGDIENFRDNAHTDLGDKLKQISESLDYEELNRIYSPYINADYMTHTNFIKNFSTTNSIIKHTRKLQKEIQHSDYFRLNFLFSILLASDKGDAIWKEQIATKEENSINRSVVDNYKKIFNDRTSPIDGLRNEAYSEAERNLSNTTDIFSLNLPTGSGKTINLLNIALKLRQNQEQRIIYCLPFTSVIDQNAAVFEEILSYNGIAVTSDILLKHHHLVDFYYSKNSEEYIQDKAEFLIETWDSKLIITTFHQLLLTIFSSNNRMLKKFHSLANSVVILDEIQTVPYRYWFLINKVFSLLTKTLNVKIILGTATMPMIFDETKNEIYELAKNKEMYFKSLNRIEINCSDLKFAQTIESFAEKLEGQISLDPESSRLVIVNTINSSLKLYQLLKEFLDIDIVYLSTNILPNERLNRIKRLKESSKGKIVISTQLVEAGVDIDFDIVYRDFAPIDSIFQACGRCNRNAINKKGVVHLIRLVNEKNKNFADFIYDKILLNHTEKCFLGSETINEAEFLTLSHMYYNNLKSLSSEALSKKLWEATITMNYEDAFHYNKDNKEAFHLIDNFKLINAFIEINEEASQILNSYRNILNCKFKDPFERRIQLKEVRRKMSPYIVSITQKYADSKEDLWIIDKEMIQNYYNSDTGFKRKQDIEDYIF